MCAREFIARSPTTLQAANGVSKRIHSHGTGAIPRRCVSATALVPPCATIASLTVFVRTGENLAPAFMGDFNGAAHIG